MRTGISRIARQSYECSRTIDEYNSSVSRSGSSLDLLVGLGPDFQQGLRGIGSSEVVVPHAAFEIVGRDVCEESALCLAATSTAVQNLWQSSLGSEGIVDLLNTSVAVSPQAEYPKPYLGTVAQVY
jgi:hypothetical protein